MSNPLEMFLGAHTFVFALFCWVGTFFIRRVVTKLWPHLKQQARPREAAPMYCTNFAEWWNEVILYAIPPTLGGLSAAAFTMYPFPSELNSLSARVLFGVVVGFFSGFLFKGAKKLMLNIVGGTEAELPSSDPPPPAG